MGNENPHLQPLIAVAAHSPDDPHVGRTLAYAYLTDLQPEAAEYGGVKVGRVWFRTLLLSGALAGLGGINYVLGYKQYYEEGFGSGAGYLGIAVALVGRNHPLGVVIAALLFATLSQGGLAVNALVPRQMVEVLTAVVIIAVATAVPEVQRMLRAVVVRRTP